MDPVTQSLLGAAAAQAVLGGKLGRWAALFGAVGGELPDIDVFFPWADPALPMEYHRHFTHALLFIPAGGLVAGLPFLLAGRWRRDWKLVLAATTIGCATHGLLDTCTSYGTFLLWPFVDGRLAWDIINIIDPLFTLVLAVGVTWALLGRAATPSRFALGLAVAYLGLGVVQHERARGAQERLAAQRHHVIERGRVMPTLGNLVVWRSIYEANGLIHADGVRVSPLRPAAVRRGEAIPLARLEDLPEAARDDDRVHHVFEGFSAFADGYVARPAARADVVADMRYSMTPWGFAPFWGIRVEVGTPGTDVAWVNLPVAGGRLGDLWDELLRGTGYEP